VKLSACNKPLALWLTTVAHKNNCGSQLLAESFVLGTTVVSDNENISNIHLTRKLQDCKHESHLTSTELRCADVVGLQDVYLGETPSITNSPLRSVLLISVYRRVAERACWTKSSSALSSLLCLVGRLCRAPGNPRPPGVPGSPPGKILLLIGAGPEASRAPAVATRHFWEQKERLKEELHWSTQHTRTTENKLAAFKGRKVKSGMLFVARLSISRRWPFRETLGVCVEGAKQEFLQEISPRNTRDAGSNWIVREEEFLITLNAQYIGFESHNILYLQHAQAVPCICSTLRQEATDFGGAPEFLPNGREREVKTLQVE
jgi:hypothetical protein